MAGLATFFAGAPSPKKPKPPPAMEPTRSAAEIAKSRQGRGLGDTNLSGLRRMAGAYSNQKASLGAG